jgi:murein tripeptide amidase MpaA
VLSLLEGDEFVRGILEPAGLTLAHVQQLSSNASLRETPTITPQIRQWLQRQATLQQQQEEEARYAMPSSDFARYFCLLPSSSLVIVCQPLSTPQSRHWLQRQATLPQDSSPCNTSKKLALICLF